MHKNEYVESLSFHYQGSFFIDCPHRRNKHIVYSKCITSFSQVPNISMIQILCAYRLPIHKLFTNIRKGF